jgi:hypothetical protein
MCSCSRLFEVIVLQIDGQGCTDLRPNDFVLMADSDRVWTLKNAPITSEKYKFFW